MFVSRGNKVNLMGSFIMKSLDKVDTHDFSHDKGLFKRDSQGWCSERAADQTHGNVPVSSFCQVNSIPICVAGRIATCS
jgi:hypothetical protein